jgi:cytochrome c oxidase cbb3-type subunit III
MSSALWLAACGRSEGGSTTGPAAHPAPSMEAIAAVPLGDIAGAGESSLALSVANPYNGNAQAVQEGRDLFVKMNCAGCHGYDAKGAMGPNLTDRYWRYGGVPVSVFKSIYEGRPQGMPAWSGALPPTEIWKLVSYIESLGGTDPTPEYQASLQGDRQGENVAPRIRHDAGPIAQPAPAASAASAAIATAARPDAGGKP